jgi:hypothetical protein
MMHVGFLKRREVKAVVDEVLPNTGLAYLTDEHEGSWTVTRSTPGVDLKRMQPGQQASLMVASYGDFSVASGFTPLD